MLGLIVAILKLTQNLTKGFYSFTDRNIVLRVFGVMLHYDARWHHTGYLGVPRWVAYNAVG